MITVATTISPSWQELGDIVLPNMIRYCKKHLYMFEVRVIPPKFEFEKIKMIIDLLKGGTDTIFCLDLDTLITNHTIRVENFLDPEHDFYLTQDINTWNTGSIIIKNTEWALGWMKAILSTEGTIENEQTAIMACSPDSMPTVKVLPHPSINS